MVVWLLHKSALLTKWESLNETDKIYGDTFLTLSTNFYKPNLTKKCVLFVFARQLRNAIKCPSYSDIYGQYNVDSAQEKCEQWTSKLQYPSAGEQEPNQSRTHKVYDSMKNFLQRKLFAQSSQKEQQVLGEEPTSDYDEVCTKYSFFFKSSISFYILISFLMRSFCHPFSRTFSTPRTMPTRRKRRRNVTQTAAAAPPPRVAAPPPPSGRPKSPCCHSTAGRLVSPAVTPIRRTRTRWWPRRSPMRESQTAASL